MFVSRVADAVRPCLASVIGIVACAPEVIEVQGSTHADPPSSPVLSDQEDGGDIDEGQTDVTSSDESGLPSVSASTQSDTIDDDPDSSSGDSDEQSVDDDQGESSENDGGDINLGPIAHAGFAVLARDGNAQLNASLSVDANGDSLTYHWFQISGPDRAVFGDQNQATTQVSRLGLAGHYVFGVSVSDGQYTEQDQVMVVSRGAPSSIVEFVFHISVDGFRPDVLSFLDPAKVPNFQRLIMEGATTMNARSDMDQTVTLPNHTCQLTGRMVGGPRGHGWITNSFGGTTLHEVKGSYVASVFDVVHDAGLRTAMYVGKSKFSMFPHSFGPESGAEDVSGRDNGRAKIDVYREIYDIGDLVDALRQTTAKLPSEYTFFHFSEPDLTGHSYGWSLQLNSEYVASVENVDRELGRILAMIDGSEILAGHSAIVLTADHGGVEWGHTEAALWQNFTIPFFVWGQGVARGNDLYALNPLTRRDPGQSKADDLSSLRQPIRHAEAANLACNFLGLPFVPGSTINPWETRLSVR